MDTKTIIMMLMFLVFFGCTPVQLQETREGVKEILLMPEVQEVIAAKTDKIRTEKWCELDPLIRIAARVAIKTKLPNIYGLLPLKCGSDPPKQVGHLILGSATAYN